MTHAGIRLRQQNQQDDVHDQQLKLHPRVVERSRQMENQLNQYHQGERQERRQQRRNCDRFLVPGIGTQRPDHQQRRKPHFQDALRPLFDASVGQDGET
jgi:hypothetical protein